MTYRFLGNSGLLVSKVSLGSWMDINDKYTADAWYDMMKLAFEHGVNFFDNAELYGGGLAEKNMGAAIKKGIAQGTWSVRTSAGTPESSRMANPLFKSLSPDFAERVAKADKLKPLAEKLGISMAELAVAWCVSNENVSTVMIGAKTMEQLEQNLKAVEALEKITSDVKAEIDSLVPFVPELSKSIGSEMTRGHFL
ncbi:hypothetical protein AM588_10003289 [Phytophthora nicotianae]|uniref:NADP-dependent oxidoreductase domain-containing protein n=1 Tax=Phytophthora nicotianae TaxID=4792 RepID=A0A0W8D0I6_PHYNI|nr:hypothetical protein AM588_10003289 [Phytophthora nicotianae]